jgi:hypothetical protein
MEKLHAAVEAEPEDSLKQAHARPPANVGGAPRPTRPREHGAGLV